MSVLYIKNRNGELVPVRTIQGEPGRGIVSTKRTSGDGSPGTTDTYTITYTDDTTDTFSVYNGADGASSEEKLVEKEFDIELSITGFTRPNGTFSPATSGLRTDYIPMDGITKIFGNAGFYASCATIAFYDENKTPLPDINVLGTAFVAATGATYGEGYFELDVTEEQYSNVAYFIVSTYRNATNGYNYTQTFEDDYCKYVKLVKGETLHYRISENTIAFFGDSITSGAGEGDYPSLIASITGASVTNNGTSGATLATGTSSTYHIVDLINTYTGTDDIICISGGINDFNKSVPIGSLTSGYADELDATTVIGALESIFRKLLTNHTEAKIYYVITHKAASAEINANSLGLTFTDYHDAIVSVLEKYSIPFYDAFASSGFVTSTYGAWGETIRNLYTVNGDGVHPNADGYLKYYVYQIISMMEHGHSSGGRTAVDSLGAMEPLIGSTDDITPAQVLQAIQSGRNIMISCESGNYGTLTFTSFHLAGSGAIVASSCAINVSGNIINASLSGDTVQNVWRCTTPTLVKQDDIPEAINTALAQAKESGEFDGEDGITPVKGVDYFTKADKEEFLSEMDVVRYGEQSLTEEHKAQARANIGARYVVTPQDYGAKGDNVTDDTAAFQNALANNRVVFVPGGTYKLSGELIIGMNCQLELAQDAFLDFTQTSGNCISMRAGSNIIGNHATINVPYAFTGKVVNIYAGIDNAITGVPPLKTGKWGPMWAAARYITDLHIVKINPSGVARSVDGTCSGTAVYLRATYQDSMNFLWAVDLNKLRIAGGFTYGIHLDCDHNPEDSMDGWIHQTKISGFITGCEVAVYLKDSTLSYISVIITPDWGADNGATYCKHGIVLENSTNVDLSGSRVMDWDTNHTLWTEGGQYQHLALIGDCAGLILNEHYYYDAPSYDIRSLIYTDTPSNLEKLVIIQEPITRWFKGREGIPYFNNGYIEKKLLLQEEFEECFNVERVPNFEDVLSKAIDKDGSLFNNGLGYYPYGKRIEGSNGEFVDAPYYGCTGFIKIKPGDTIYTDQITWTNKDGHEVAVLFDSNFNRIVSCTSKQVTSMTYFFDYESTDEGFALTVKSNYDTAQVAYIALSFRRELIGDNPTVSVNMPITFSQQGFLADSIDIKSENVHGLTETINALITSAIGSAIGGSY